MAELEALGLRNVPVTKVGEKVVVGFNQEELARLLDLSGKKEKKLADRRFFDTLDKIVGAVIRAVRQVPSDHIRWPTPDQHRPLKVFCFHILADPNHVLEAVSTGKFDGSFKLAYAEASESFRDMEAVARFGEETRKRLTEASPELTADVLDRRIDGYAGQTDGHELLHQVLSHTAHHLRQLYEMLRMIGVEPVNPLKEEDFKEIPMPQELW